jgi:hypothetical protein
MREIPELTEEQISRTIGKTWSRRREPLGLGPRCLTGSRSGP